MRHLGLVAAVCAAVVCSGCLREKKSLTLYVAENGIVTWMVVEKDVRSDEKTAARREREEQDYIAAARRGDHPVARAFRRLTPSSLATQVIRGDRPFAVVTTATFPSLDAMGDAVIASLRANATSRLESHGEEITWTMTIAADDPADEDAAADLIALFDRPWHVVLENGSFVRATGFDLRDDGRIAVRHDLEDAADETPIVWSLTWRNAR